MHITLKIPLMDDHMTARKLLQLDRLTGRDTTVINRYLTILQADEDQLWNTRYEGLRIDRHKLDELTLTSAPLYRQGQQSTGRLHVKYDLKREFGHCITVRELKECRDTAVEMWHAHRDRVKKHERRYWRILQDLKYVEREEELARVAHWWLTKKSPAAPCQADDYHPKKLPRRATLQTTAFLHEQFTQITQHWIELYYSLDKGSTSCRCRRLWLPLNCSSYHLNGLQTGTPKTVQLVKHREKNRWYAHIAVKLRRTNQSPRAKPLAVLALDLGMKKTVTAVLLTENHKLVAKDIRMLDQKEKKQSINQLDNLIASLQQKKDTYQNKGTSPKNVLRKLKLLRHKRHQLALQYDHLLTAQIVHWVRQLEHTYTVYVVLGTLKGIRQSRRKGDGKSRKHRRELHRWAFARITGMLQAKLRQAGLPSDRFRSVAEAWTSKRCSKCGSTDTSRPFQALIICHQCGAKLQADINGAINIGIKLIGSLDEATLDQWLTKPFLDEKYSARNVRVAGRKASCTRKPSRTSSPKSGNETKSEPHVSVIPTQIGHIREAAPPLPGYDSGTRKLRTNKIKRLARSS